MKSSVAQQQQVGYNDYDIFMAALFQRYGNNQEIPAFVAECIDKFQHGLMDFDNFSFHVQNVLQTSPDLINMQSMLLQQQQVAQPNYNSNVEFHGQPQQAQGPGYGVHGEDLGAENFLQRVEVALQNDINRQNQFFAVLKTLRNNQYTNDMHGLLLDIFVDHPQLLVELYALAPITQPNMDFTQTLSMNAAPQHLQLQPQHASHDTTAEGTLSSRIIAVPSRSIHKLSLLDTIKAAVPQHVWAELVRLMHLLNKGILPKSEFISVCKVALTQHANQIPKFLLLMKSTGAQAPNHVYRTYYEYMENVSKQGFPSLTKSYRGLPFNLEYPECTQYSELAKSVLSKHLISVPLQYDEESVLKRNPYEEHLAGIEEERYELTILLECTARLRVVLSNYYLEAINDITGVAPLVLSPVMKRALVRIYEKNTPEVLSFIAAAPLRSLPVIIERLDATIVEWKNAQKELTPTWAAACEANLHRALDFRGDAWRVLERDQRNSKKQLLGLVEHAFVRLCDDLHPMNAFDKELVNIDGVTMTTTTLNDVSSTQSIDTASVTDLRDVSLLRVQMEVRENTKEVKTIPIGGLTPNSTVQLISPLQKLLHITAAKTSVSGDQSTSAKHDLLNIQPQVNAASGYCKAEYCYNSMPNNGITHILAYRILMLTYMAQERKAEARSVDLMVRGVQLPLLRVAPQIRAIIDEDCKGLREQFEKLSDDKPEDEVVYDAHRFGRNAARSNKRRLRNFQKIKRAKTEQAAAAAAMPVAGGLDACGMAAAPSLYDTARKLQHLTPFLRYGDLKLDRDQQTTQLMESTALSAAGVGATALSVADIRKRTVFVTTPSFLSLIHIYLILICRLSRMTRLAFLQHKVDSTTSPIERLDALVSTVVTCVASNEIGILEDVTRDLFGECAYPMFTIDKLILQLSKQSVTCSSSALTYTSIVLADIHATRVPTLYSDDAVRHESMSYAAQVLASTNLDLVFMLAIRDGVVSIGTVNPALSPATPFRFASNVRQIQGTRILRRNIFKAMHIFTKQSATHKNMNQNGVKRQKTEYSQSTNNTSYIPAVLLDCVSCNELVHRGNYSTGTDFFMRKRRQPSKRVLLKVEDILLKTERAPLPRRRVIR